MTRLSGPGTRSKNTQKYDAKRREMEDAGVEFPRGNSDGRGPQLSKRKARLEARRADHIATMQRRPTAMQYRAPGSMSK